MERLVALASVLAFVSVCHTASINTGDVTAENGEIAIGHISGATFGPGSFSIGGRPLNISDILENEDSDGEHNNIIIKPTDNNNHQNRPPHRNNQDETNNSGGGKRDNTQPNPAKPLNAHIYSGHDDKHEGGKRGEGSSGHGQIIIGTAVHPNHKSNKVNKNKNYNRKPVANDASSLEAIYASNSGESIQFDAIIGGHFEAGSFSIGNKGIPAANRPGINPAETQGAVRNENTRYPNTGNEALYTIGHGANINGAGYAGDGDNYGRKRPSYSSGTYEEPWIWS